MKKTSDFPGFPVTLRGSDDGELTQRPGHSSGFLTMVSWPKDRVTAPDFWRWWADPKTGSQLRISDDGELTQRPGHSSGFLTMVSWPKDRVTAPAFWRWWADPKTGSQFWLSVGRPDPSMGSWLRLSDDDERTQSPGHSSKFLVDRRSGPQVGVTARAFWRWSADPCTWTWPAACPIPPPTRRSVSRRPPSSPGLACFRWTSQPPRQGPSWWPCRGSLPAGPVPGRPGPEGLARGRSRRTFCGPQRRSVSCGRRHGVSEWVHPCSEAGGRRCWSCLQKPCK